MPKTYQNIVDELEKATGGLFAPLFFKTGLTWVRLDKKSYLRELKNCTNLAVLEFPCWMEFDRDGDAFFHPNISPNIANE